MYTTICTEPPNVLPQGRICISISLEGDTRVALEVTALIVSEVTFLEKTCACNRIVVAVLSLLAETCVATKAVVAQVDSLE